MKITKTKLEKTISDSYQRWEILFEDDEKSAREQFWRKGRLYCNDCNGFSTTSQTEMICNLQRVVLERWKRTETMTYEERAKDMVQKISNYVNCFNPSHTDFATFVTAEHHTLQQGMARLFVACIQRWADYYDKGYFDARNEAICKLSAEIVKNNETYLPFI